MVSHPVYNSELRIDKISHENIAVDEKKSGKRAKPTVETPLLHYLGC